jgi:hypothetical protein
MVNKIDSRASYNFRNVYFMDGMLEAELQSSPETSDLLSGIPPYMHMLRHVYRSANYTKPGQVGPKINVLDYIHNYFCSFMYICKSAGIFISTDDPGSSPVRVQRK